MKRLSILFLVLIAACASRSSWNPTTRTMCRAAQCYEVGPLAAAWQPVMQKQHVTGFFNAGSGGIITSNASCRDDAEAASLPSLTAHMLVGYTERHERSSVLLYLAGREALRTVLDAKLDGVPVVLDLYVLKRNGCVFDLSYAAPPPGYEAGLADFQRFVDGFSQLPRPRA